MNDVVLDILGQQSLNIFTQICFCYSMGEDGKSKDEILETLSKGLERLTEGFPWVAGQVVNERGEVEDDTGVFKIKGLERIPRLIVKDVSEQGSIPSMEELRKASFPIRMLDESFVAPRSTIPGIFSESSDVPVFILQATFIKNGLILTFLGQHQVMDGTGQAHVISLLSKACCGERFTKEELETGNMGREDIIPLLTGEEKSNLGDLHQKLAHQIIPNPSPSSNQEPPECAWACFNFPSSSLSKLKLLASKDLPSSTSFITTDDALTAFVWQSVSRIRLSRLSPYKKSTLARAVNVRPYLNIPSTYPGMVQNMTYNDFTISQLTNCPLGIIASQLRSNFDPKLSTLDQDTRALATFLDSAKNKSITSFTATLDFSSDIALSSWVKQNSYSLDFGIGLYNPESVRRPQFTPVESLMYLLPKTPNGDVTLVICLRNTDMNLLKSDKQFIKYATCIS